MKPWPKTPITVRRMDFEFDDVPRYWFKNDPFATHLLNAMSATFPEGERFFVHTVRAFRDRITDPVLQKEVGAFIGQEAMHAKEHDGFNRYLAGLGLDVASIERHVVSNIERIKRELPPEQQLAITCALEHFTAIMAEQLLSKPALLEGMHPQMRALWAWHAIEENEHKAVAFDVYQQYVGDEALRRRVMRIATVMFVSRNSYYLLRLLKEDGLLFKPKVWRDGLRTLWGKDGFLRGMAKSYRDYYRADFHPWESDTRGLLAQWKAKLGLDSREDSGLAPAQPVAAPRRRSGKPAVAGLQAQPV